MLASKGEVVRSTLVVALFCFAVGASATMLYTQRTSFESSFETILTDHYSPADGYPAGMNIYNDAGMTAVFGETIYTSTGIPNLNLVNNGVYCAGCNGSFRLTFTQTSIGSAQGVSGVGLDIVSNSSSGPYWAFVTLGDDSQINVPLPAGSSFFFGIADPIGIKSIHFGLHGGLATTTGGFIILETAVGGSR